MAHISDLLNEGDVFLTDLYKENKPSVYLVLEKDLDTMFGIMYFTLLSDKGQTLLVNSNYLDLKKEDVGKIND